MIRKLVTLAVVPILFLFFVGTASGVDSQPIDSIKRTVERIIQVVTEQSFQGEENETKRRETILLLVNQRFNFYLMIT